MSKICAKFSFILLFVLISLPNNVESGKKKNIKKFSTNANETTEEPTVWSNDNDWGLWTIWTVGIVVFLIMLLLIFHHCKTYRKNQKRNRNQTIRNSTPTFKYNQDSSRVQMLEPEPIPLGFSAIEQSVQQSQRNPYGSTTEPLHLHNFSKLDN